MKAKYTKSNVAAYKGNPLIEALPPLLSSKEVGRALRHEVPYDEEERQLPTHEREHCLISVLQFFEPLPHHIDLEAKLSRTLRFGYVGRNPLAKGFWQDIPKTAEKVAANLEDEERPHWGRNRSWKGGKDPKGYVKIIHFNEEQFNSKSINVEKLPEVLQTRLETFVFIVSFGLNAAILRVDPEKPTQLSEPEILQGTEGRHLIAPAYHDTYCHAIRGIPIWEEAPKPMFQELDDEANLFPIPSPKEFDPAALFGGEAHGNYITVLVQATKEGEKWALQFPQLTDIAPKGNVFSSRRKAICLVMAQGRKRYTLLIKKRGKDPEDTHFEVAENQEEVNSYYEKEIRAAQELETLGGDDLKIGWEEPYPITDYNYVDDAQLEIIEDFVKGHEVYDLCAGNTDLARLCLDLGATKITTVDIGKRETLRYLYPSKPAPEGKIEEITHDLSTGLPPGHAPTRAIIASPPPNHVASKQPDWESILPNIPHVLYIGANVKGKHPCGSPKFWAQLIPREITSVRVRSHGGVIEYGPNPREGNQVLREEGLGLIQTPGIAEEQSNCLGEGQAEEILELLRRANKK